MAPDREALPIHKTQTGTLAAVSLPGKVDKR